MKIKTLMVQGTTSDAGKSILVTGLCRVFLRQGIAVAPFKPQNMALNSAVSADGGEIGRAQALQAAACRLEPHTDMNPVLLKPSSDRCAQVIIQGHALSTMDAQDYHGYKKRAKQAVFESYHRLGEQYQLVVVEGAGSPAEINLREGDIANMGFAEEADCPVILVADIDRGGVFAHLVGTLALLSSSEQARVAGFVINRFRGDIALLESGLEWLEQETGKPVFGVLPYLHDLHLDAEDAIQAKQVLGEGERLRVVVPVLPRISNHTDFDPLRLHPQVELIYVPTDSPIPPADLIVIPGSKNVREDLRWLRKNGWEEAIQRHLRYGGKLLGICGGYQMLGECIDDPQGIEGVAGSEPGLGLLSMVTELQPGKHLRNVTGRLWLDDTVVSGYEIHCGVTQGRALLNPAVILDHAHDGAQDGAPDGAQDGAISEDGQVAGSYLHGLFEQPEALSSLLRWAGLDAPETHDHKVQRETEIERLADMLEQYLDMNAISALLELDTSNEEGAKQ